MDVWAAACIFAELLLRRPFLQVNLDYHYYYIQVHYLASVNFEELVFVQLDPSEFIQSFAL